MDSDTVTYLYTISDQLTVRELQDLLRENNLSTTGRQSELRARLQLHYLGLSNPSTKLVEAVRHFFTSTMDKKSLLRELEHRGLKGDKKHKCETIRRILSMMEVQNSQGESSDDDDQVYRSAGEEEYSSDEEEETREEEPDQDSHDAVGCACLGDHMAEIAELQNEVAILALEVKELRRLFESSEPL